MAQTPTIAGKTSPFEKLKRTNPHGAEFWSARDLQPLLGYHEWRKFEGAIKKAITSCKESGNEPEHHFVGADKMITLGKGGQRKVKDYRLSRFACYLIAQNGDPRKSEIARAQKYFAVQTRRQELSDAARADEERLQLHAQTSQAYNALSDAARDAGVDHEMFGVFHDAGFKGLYGMGEEQLKTHKGIARKEAALDRMDTTELAANQFRLTQTREKLRREGIATPEEAIQTHSQIGKEVRRAISRIGGAMPETQPPAEPITKVEKRLGKQKQDALEQKHTLLKNES